MLTQIARRPAETKTLGSNAGVVTLEDQELFLSENVQKGKSVVDDVTEVIELPAFDPKLFVDAIDPDSVVIKGSVVKQLREYVTIIASSYRNNPFHNYEHGTFSFLS